MALTECSTTLNSHGIGVGWSQLPNGFGIVFIENPLGLQRVEMYARDRVQWRNYAKMLRLAAKAADEFSKIGDK